MKRCVSFIVVCVTLFFAPLVMADSSISDYFSKKLNKINSFLAEKHDEALQNPELLVSFVDRELLKVWSAKNTVRAMLGAERWSQLSNTETEQLITAYENTIRRYLFEILEQYKDQLATVESVRLNTKGNKGWLRVTLESQSLPDFNVDLKIYKESTLWTVYDFSFQGISFVKMKRGFFRNTFDRHGVEGVIEQLNQKNQEFKQSLLASNGK